MSTSSAFTFQTCAKTHLTVQDRCQKLTGQNARKKRKRWHKVRVIILESTLTTVRSKSDVLTVAQYYLSGATMVIHVETLQLSNDLSLVPHRMTRRSKGTEKKAAYFSALRDTGYGELARVGLDFDQNSVHLFGEVSSFYLKQLAQEAIRPLAIGLRIVNRIHVART